MSFVAGAGLALVGATAWRAFVHHAGVEPAETVLVHGGAGGVGHVAVQLAATMGARVVATASPADHDALAALGADSTLDYAAADLADRVADAGPPDVILDTRFDDYLQFDADVAAPGARIVAIGNASETAAVDAAATLKSKELTYQFTSMYNTPDLSAVLERLATLADRGAVTPTVHRTYALDEAADAQRAVIEDSFLGKLVVTP